VTKLVVKIAITGPNGPLRTARVDGRFWSRDARWVHAVSVGSLPAVRRGGCV